jgi:ABC-type branched-subunit amino acid transport system ATPase component
VTAAPGARDEVAAKGESGALALHGITRRFGEYTAVDNISVEVGPGELLAVV